MLEQLQTLATANPKLFAWLSTLTSALLAALVVALAYGLAHAVISRLLRGRSFATTLLQAARNPGRAAVILLSLQVVWEAAPEDLPRRASVEHLTALGLTIALTWLGVRCVAGIAETIIATHPVSAADNLQARRVQTQTRVLTRIVMGIIVFIGIALALMSFPAVRNLGTSLLASAGVAGLVFGLAARPALGNLIAGVQLALAQPIRLDDVVVIDGQWGRIEEIRGTYVVVQIWDQRRLIVPLQWFLEHSFENWTLTSADILGTVFIWVDYRLPLPPLEAELQRLCKAAPEWDGRVCVLQVTDTNERAMQLRALMSSADSSRNWDLRCRVRAGLIAYLQAQYPDCLPRTRVAVDDSDRDKLSGKRDGNDDDRTAAPGASQHPVAGGGQQ